ncbi:MAG: hypothetical protein QOH60_515 [Mycobacterium sp.]|jgi:nucleotide-binding universal stress UspA family protein|nr:hypothetical protein [Mycobacterium sp.]
MKVFISYSRGDEAAVRSLAEDLRQRARVHVWVDRHLGDGDAWWSTILKEIRECTVFVFALSDKFLDCKLCQAELDYAKALNVPILPVQIGDVTSFRADLIFTLQLVDYRDPASDRAFDLVPWLHSRAAQHTGVPDPLPEAPPNPYEYLQGLGGPIHDTTTVLAPSAQAQLLIELRSALSGEDEEAVLDYIRNLLGALRRRADVTYAVASDLDTILGKAGPVTTGGALPMSGTLSVEKIREISLPGGGRIELCVGDIAAMTARDGCDLLVVSAFPGDYSSTRRSVIEALGSRGLSVAALAANPEIDLRATSSCWLSRAMPPGRNFGFDRLLCFEPAIPHTAASTVGDIFRTLVPFVGPEIGIRDVAMPIVASGNQGVPREEMLTAILAAAGRWMEFGLPLNRLRIVMYHRGSRDPAIAAFDDFAHAVQGNGSTAGSAATTEAKEAETENEAESTVFVSYAHADGRPAVDEIRSHISAVAPSVHTLVDIADIDVGAYWQTRIAELIQSSNVVVLVVTEGFWRSKVCLEEYNMARVLDSDRGGGVLFPICALSCDLPLHFRILNFEDCREADQTRLREACDRLVATLGTT